MSSIDTRYFAVLPPSILTQTEATEFLGITAKTSAQQGRAGNASLADIDWSSFGATSSHQAITINASTNNMSGAALDTMVDTILSHIGSRVLDK